MPKNYEKINPLHEEAHEEDARVYEGDKSHSYVPIEQVADKEPVSPLNEIPEEDELDDEVAQDRVRKELEEIYINHSGGVASVGPDVEGESISVDHVVIGEKAPAKKPARISRRKTDKQITSMSPGQVTRESRSHIKIKKDTYRGNTGKEGDNLKTMPDSKKQRTFRQKIRDFFNKPI